MGPEFALTHERVTDLQVKRYAENLDLNVALGDAGFEGTVICGSGPPVAPKELSLRRRTSQ